MRGAVVLVLVLSSGLAGADDQVDRPGRRVSIRGEITATSARWTGDGSRIVTEATVRTPDGSLVTVSQLGGTVDGLTMRQFPGPEPLVPGMHVALAVREDTDLAARMHRAVDDVRVLVYPPNFVRTGPTKAGAYLKWASGCAFLTPDSAGSTQIPAEGEFEVIDASVAEWQTKTASCSYLKLQLEPRRLHEVGRDDINMIKFREQSWCRPKIGDDPARCYSPQAAGITTATYVDDSDSGRDGEIVDADIEINGVDFAIAKDGVTLGTAACKAELANTLTHELGHFQGLEHPCLAAGDPPRVDGDGDPVPACGVNDPEITEATMYNFQECGETKKATIEADDIAGICAIYPGVADPNTCERVGEDTGCCSASGAPGGAVAVYAGLGLVVLGALGRRRRSKT